MDVKLFGNFLSFSVAADLQHVQNQWIKLSVWLDLMKNVAPHLDVVSQLARDKFKRAMLNKDYNMVSTNMKEVNENGYYYNSAYINLDGRGSQHVNAILVTQPGELPM